MNPEASGAVVASDGDVAAVRQGLSPAVRTVRVTYPDLHGVQRGKDVPVSELERTAEGGLAFCWAVMGTDLSHTPVVGGEQRLPGHARPPRPLDPGRAAMGARRRRLSGRPRGRGRPRAHRHARPRSSRRGGARRARSERRRSAPSSSSTSASPTARVAGVATWTTSAWSTRSAPRPTPRACKGHARRLRGAWPRRDRRQPRVHEQPVRDQPARVRAARRRRQRLSLQGGGQGLRRPARPAGDLHGQAVQ